MKYFITVYRSLTRDKKNTGYKYFFMRKKTDQNCPETNRRTVIFRLTECKQTGIACKNKISKRNTIAEKEVFCKALFSCQWELKLTLSLSFCSQASREFHARDFVP